MNRVFRIVRRKSDGRLVVAGELAKSAVKGLGATMALLSSLAAFASTIVGDVSDPAGPPDAVVDSAATLHQVTTVYETNGTQTLDDDSSTTSITTNPVAFSAPVVTINAPSADGISHNRYTQFDVSATGVVLNNVQAGETALITLGATDPTTSGTQVTSTQFQLDGHAGGGATVILNEVLSGNASTLAGAIEVGGDTADVIIANPDGITCNACTFTNATGVTLATGSVSVTGADITFGLSDSALTIGDGTDSTVFDATDLALISRRIEIDGRINAANLELVAHNGSVVLDTSAGSYSYNDTGADSSTAPEYAIDSTAFGGMYANAITLIANESGTGVRALANMAALGGEMTITADGKLVIGSNDATATELSAQTVALTSNTDDITLTEVNVSADDSTDGDGGSIALTASAGDVVLSEGTLSSTSATDDDGGDLTITAVDLTDSTAHQVDGDVHTRSASGNLTLNLSGDFAAQDSSYSTSGTLDVDAASIALSDNASLNSTGAGTVDLTNDSTIAGKLVFGTGTSNVTVSAGTLAFAATSDVSANQLNVSASGALTIAAGSGWVTRSGLSLIGSTVASDASMSVAGNMVVGDANTTSLTLGQAATASLIEVAGTASFDTDTFDLYSVVEVTGATNIASTGANLRSTSAISGGALTLTADTLALAGALSQSGATSLSTTGAMTLADGATLATTAGANMVLNAGGLLTNRAQVSSAGTLSIGDGASGSSLLNTGSFESVGTLTVDLDGQLYNQAVISATVAGRNLGRVYDESTFTSALTDTVEDELTIDSSQLGSLMSSAGDLSITAASVVNEGALSAATTVDLTGTTLRSQMAGIYDGSVHAGDSRADLTTARAKYNYINTTGVETYYTDDVLTVGRATAAPTISGATLTLSGGNNLSLGTALDVTNQTGTLTEVDLSTNRVLTTNTSTTAVPNVDATVADNGTVTAVANGQTTTTITLGSNDATTVVDIAQPNDNGLSNNTYSRFDVNASGLILNNQPFSNDVTVTSELSAVISANSAITRSASVILNQVYATDASRINGFIEVAGASADVLIANPLGLYCDSCGVINIDRFDLVVGGVNLTGGLVSGFDTSAASGTLHVNGSGLNAVVADAVGVFSPVAYVKGSFNAQDLFMGLGGGTFSRGALTADPYDRLTTEDQTQSRALLVTTPAGLFANTIEIDSGSSNVDGSMALFGELAANAGDLIINTDGIITLSGRMSATDDLAVTTTSANNSDSISVADFQLINGSITAGDDLTLTMDAGSLVANGGQIYSFDTLTIDAKTLVDTATSNPAESNNTRFATTDMSLQVDSVATLTGTIWEGDTVALTDGGAGTLALTLGEDTRLKANSSLDMDVRTFDNSGSVMAMDLATLDASGAVTNHSAGIYAAANRSTLTANALTNAGTWMGVQNDTASGGATWDVVTINNQAGGMLSMADAWTVNRSTGSLTNSGTITSDISTALTLASVTNNATFNLSLRDSGAASVWQVSTLTNNSDGDLFAGDDWSVNSDGSRGSSITNTGTFQGYNSLVLAFDTLNLPAGETLSGALSGVSGESFDLFVSNAYTHNSALFSGEDMQLDFDGGLRVNADGAIMANGDLNLSATDTNADLINYGFIYAAGDAALTADDRIGNFVDVTTRNSRWLGRSNVNGATYYERAQTEVSRAEIRTGGSLTLTGDLIVNSSEIRAGDDLTVVAATIANQAQRTSGAGFTTDNPIANTTNRLLNFSTSTQRNSWYDYPDDYETTITTYKWEEHDYFKDGVPAVKPVMMSGGEYTITGTHFKNYGGLLQATGAGTSTINVTGNFTNDSLTTEKQAFSYQKKREIKYAAKGPAKYYDRTSTYASQAGDTTQTRAGFANVLSTGSLTITGNPTVSNVGSYVPSSSSNSVTSSTAMNPTGFSMSITLPSRPNGFFVTNRDPSATYLVEMNPNLQPGVSTLGSDYLMETLNIDTDTTMRRLGDSGYEAYLVEQQLIEQTGAGVLEGYNNIADVMSGFMQNAATQAGQLDLTMGQPLTPEQIGALDEPMIWMVEIVIDGETLLAPQVYLPEDVTDEAAQRTASIEADDLTLEVASLDNLGGDINANGDLTLTAVGDITNVSGGIGGENVTLNAGGDITNETFNQFTGTELEGQTQIGRTATIAASNDLELTAGGDITNLGADVSAGNNATLNAEGDITFDTIQDRTTTYEQSSGAQSFTSTSTDATNQVRSGLDVGGDLASTSGGDTTFAGTVVNVDGDADIETGGDLNIVARENTFESETQSVSSGFGGGQIFSRTESTTETRSIRNVGSEFNVGGDATIDSAGDVTLQGSELAVAGDTSIDANSLQVLQGRNLDETKTETNTTSIGISVQSMDNVDGSTSTGVSFASNVNETTETLSQRAVGSTLATGGNLTINTTEDVTLQGSEIEAGGNVDIDAADIRLLAAQNIERTETTRTEVNMGLFASGESEGDAGAGAGTETSAGTETGGSSVARTGSAEASASAQAGAQASGSASATLDFAVGRTDRDLALDITNTGSLIRSGGDLTLNADNTIELEGSEIVADGDVDVSATDILAREARDISIRESEAESVRIGLYADAGGGAEAGAEAKASASANGAAGVSSQSNEAKAGASAAASAEAGGKAGIGMQTQVASLTETNTETTAQVSAIRSNGGSITRTATNSITDVGTEIEAAENFTQSAQEINSFAARNESTSERSYEEVTARVGVYVEAEGEASASAGASGSVDSKGAEGQAGAQASAEGGARAGIEVQVDTLSQTERQSNTEAVVSNIVVGGNVSSTSEGSSTFEGTNIAAGGDLSVTGEDINIVAARNTSETSFSQTETNSRVAMAVGVGGSAEAGAQAKSDGSTKAGADAEGGVKVRAEISTRVATEDETTTGTEAVVANFSAGGDLDLDAENNVNIEGANLEADTINVNADELNFTAAADTSTTTSSSTEVEVEVMVEATIVGKAGVEGEGSVNVSNANASGESSDAVVGSINAANLNITTTNDANFEGTQVTATESANLDVGGALNVTAAASTTSERSAEQTVSVEVAANSDGEVEAGVDVGVGGASSRSSDATVAAFNVGSLNLTTGEDANFEGTQVNVDGAANLDVGGDLNVTAARNTASSESRQIDVSVDVEVGDGVGVDVGVNVSEESAQSSEALAGAFNVGSLDVTTGGDANFEGTQVTAEGDANLDIGGDLNVTAARSTEQSSSLDVGVEVGFGSTSSSDEDKGETTSGGSGSFGVEVGVAESSSNQAAAGLLGAGGSLNIQTGGDATFEGTDLAGGDGIELVAGGDVAFNEALSTSSNTEVGVGVGFGRESETTTQSNGDSETETTTSGNASLDLALSSSAQGEGSTISGGDGGIIIRSGGDVALQGTEFEGESEIDAQGDITRSELTSESSDFSMDFAVEGKSKDKSSTSGGSADGNSTNEGAGTDAAPVESQPEATGSNARSSSASEANEETLTSASDDDVDSRTRQSETENDAADSQPLVDSTAGTEKEKDELPDRPKNSFLNSAEKSAAGASSKGEEEASEVPEEATEDAPAPESVTPQQAQQPAPLVMTGDRVSLVEVAGDSALTNALLTDDDGDPVPEWVSIDLESGELVVDKPEDFDGELSVRVELPNGRVFYVEVE